MGCPNYAHSSSLNQSGGGDRHPPQSTIMEFHVNQEMEKMELDYNQVRISYSPNKGKFSIYKHREDKNGWRNVAYRNSVLLLNPVPHFYRGTQKRWLNGEMRWRTPFSFLEGIMIEDTSIVNGLPYKGNLYFNCDQDEDFVWEYKGNYFIISDEKKSYLPSNYGAIAFCSNSHPVYEVYDLSTIF